MMAAYWFAFQTPIPGEETLLSLSEKGVGVILALSILLLFVVAALALLLWDRWQARQASKSAAAERAAVADNEADTSQILELAKAIGVLATTNSASLDRQSAAIERQSAAQEKYAAAQAKLAESMTEQSGLLRQLIELHTAQTGEHERISLEVAAKAVDTVMGKLEIIESKLHGQVMTRQLDELKADMAAIRKLLAELQPVIVKAVAPVVSTNDTKAAHPAGGEAT